MTRLHRARVDVVIIGAGIAGLWLAHRLRRAGRSAVILESRKTGCGQTVASQGIIHGGTKYALTNRITGASEAIAQMPARWKSAIAAAGEIDLAGAHLLADAQHLWSLDSLSSKVTTFFAAAAMRNRVRSLPRAHFPSLLAHEQFRGSVYRIEEFVLDVPAVLSTITASMHAPILAVDVSGTSIERSAAGAAGAPLHVSCSLARDGLAARIDADAVVCAAGAGSEALLQSVGAEGIAVQHRPLHMVLVRGPLQHRIYGHCLGAGPRPRLTITSHDWDAAPDQRVWYLGGELAEAGVKRPRQAQIDAARAELAATLPWVDQANLEWDAFMIDRVEAAQQRRARPDQPIVREAGRVLFAWPTKLAFAPLLADRVIERVESLSPTPCAPETESLRDWPAPPLAPPPWKETRQWRTFDR